MLLLSISLKYCFPTLYPELMSIPDVEECFFNAAESWILFVINAVILYHFLFVCLFVFLSFIEVWKWDHWYWEISVSNDCWFPLFCCCTGGSDYDGAGGVCMCTRASLLFSLLVCKYLFPCFHACSQPPNGGVFLLALLGLD